jgi:hypothetical protein
MGGSGKLFLPFPFCTGIDNYCHLQKEHNATTSFAPLPCRLFFRSASHISVWASLSSLFQVAGKEEERTRGVSLLEAMAGFCEGQSAVR